VVQEAYVWVREKAPVMESAAGVAEALVGLVEAERPPLRGQTAESARAWVAARWIDPTGERDRQAFVDFLAGLRARPREGASPGGT